MFIPDLDFCPSRIPDPGSRSPDQKQQQKGGGGNWLSYLFCSHKYHKTGNYFILELEKKKIEPIYKELYYFLPRKIFTKLSNMVSEPGSELRDPEKTYSPILDPGSRGQKGSDPDPQHWLYLRCAFLE
jgi:hypothetical protein